jgi:hypothetical protein
VCGKTASLTFEHVPPKSSGNAARRRSVDTLTDMASRGDAVVGVGVDAEGVGLYATCRDCNSFSGTHYVPAHSDVVASMLDALELWATSTKETPPPETLSLTLQRIHPGAIIRQVLFMVMATSGSAGLTSRYPELRRIVLTKGGSRCLRRWRCG